MERIQVSPEMVTYVGAPTDARDLPIKPISFALTLGATPTLAIADPDAADAADLVCFVAESACRRIFDHAPVTSALYHLPAELRAIAVAIRDCALPAEARTTLRLAKSIELLCAIFAALGDDSLVLADADGALSERDTRRIVLARRMIDDRWREKLTLDTIARGAGLNRAKLTRGFRTMFGTSVGDALTERRLGGARALLLSTDLPVSSVGYACGYLNNASFTRAFARRYGMVPTRLRATGAAA